MRVLFVAALVAAVLLPSAFIGASAAKPVFSAKVCKGMANDAIQRQKDIERLSTKWLEALKNYDNEKVQKAVDRQNQVRAYLTELGTIYSAFCKP